MTTLFGTPASRQVVKTLKQAGFEAYFVGGAVRDFLRGVTPHDFDIATSAEPSEVQALFPKTFDVGIAHGTVLVRQDDESIEVTTFRTEGTYSDHRRPDYVHFVTSLREDLKRRDFTVNALAMTEDGELIDYFGGQQDLRDQCIRAVGKASERFQEDALRMIRAIRFVATLQFSIETETFQAITHKKEQIRNLAVERIKIELDKLVVGKSAYKALQLIEQSKLNEVLPLFPLSIQQLAPLFPCSHTIEGWAGLMIAGQFTPLEMARAYKLSNDEKQQLQLIEQLYSLRRQQPLTSDELYDYPLHVLQTVEKYIGGLFPTISTATAVQIEEAKNALPIQSFREVAVTGKDLMNWANERGGSWTGQWLKKIERAVLHKQCENDSEKIKEWFLHAYKREG